MADEPVIGGVSVSVTADLNQYNADMDAAKAKAVAFDQAASQAMGHTAQATTQAAAAIGTLSAAQLKLVQDTLGADNAMIASKARGAAAQQIYAEAVKVSAAAQAKATVATVADTAATTTNTVSHVNSKVATEALTIVHEVLSGRMTRVTGSSMILGQAMLGQAKTAALLSAAMSPVGLTIIGITAAAIAGTAALIAYEKAQRELAISAVGLGAQSGVSSGQINEASQQGLGSFKSSINDNLKAMEAFSAAGVKNIGTLRELAGVTSDYAALTGEKAKDATKDLAEAMKDPVKGAEELNQKLGLLDATQLQQIRTLTELGDKAEAQAIITDALKQRTEEADKASGGLQSTAHKLGAAFSDAATGIGAATDQLIRWAITDAKFRNGDLNAPEEAAQAARARAEAQARIQREAQNKAASAAGLPIEQQTPEAKGQSERDNLLGQRNTLIMGRQADRELGDADEVKRKTAALADVNRALQTYTELSQRAAKAGLSPEAEKQVEMLHLEAQATKAKTEAQKNAIAQQKEALELTGKVMSQADANALISSAGDRGGARARTPKDTFTSDLASIQEDTAGEVALARAYGESSAAAIEAEATRKILTEATKAGRTEAQKAALVQAQIARDMGADMDSAAKAAAALQVQTDAQRRADDAVAAGTMTRAEASRMVKDAAELEKAQAAATSQNIEVRVQAIATLERLKAAQKAANDEADRGLAIDSAAKDKDEIALANLRASMIGQPKAKQDVAVARMQRGQQLGPATSATPEGQASIQSAGDVAQAQSNVVGLQQYREMTLQVQKETEAQQKLQATMGMTLIQADKYNETQKLILEAQKDGIALDPTELANIDKLATGYAKASDEARKFAQAQKGAADAANDLTDKATAGLESIIFDGAKASDVARNMAKSLGKEAFEATMSGKGPLAGLLGTNQSQTEGGPNGGLISGVMGSLFGQGKPDGTATNPLHVKTDGPANDNSGGGLLSSLFGGSGGQGGGIGGMFSSLFGGGGAAAGSAAGGLGDLTEFAGLFHTGTSYVGTPSRQIPVSPKLFASAPRLHSGLAPDEFPAILQKGERVTAKNGNSRSGGHTTIMNITTNDAASFGRSAPQIERRQKRAMGRPG